MIGYVNKYHAKEDNGESTVEQWLLKFQVLEYDLPKSSIENLKFLLRTPLYLQPCAIIFSALQFSVPLLLHTILFIQRIQRICLLFVDKPTIKSHCKIATKLWSSNQSH